MSDFTDKNGNGFKIVQKIPHGFITWNVPKLTEEGTLVPFCELKHPEDPECYNVNTNTLVAVYFSQDEAEQIRKAAHRGGWDVKAIDERMRRKETTPEELTVYLAAREALKRAMEPIATTPVLKEYTVTYIINEEQDRIVNAWADKIGTTPEKAFEFIMTLGATFDINDKLELIRKQLN